MVLKMGALYTACTDLAVIGKRFGGAELGDGLMKCSVTVSEAMAAVPEEQHYNHATGVYNILLEDVMYLVQENFGTWLEDDPYIKHAVIRTAT